MAALRRDKRALHDLIAGSRVERPIAPRPVVRRVVAAPAPPMPVEPPPMTAEPVAACRSSRARRRSSRRAARVRAVARVLPTLPLRVRNRLASTIVAALGDEHARRELRALAADDATARGWLAPDEDQLAAAVRERARRAAGALADRPALAPDADLGQTLQAAGLLFDAGPALRGPRGARASLDGRRRATRARRCRDSSRSRSATSTSPTATVPAPARCSSRAAAACTSVDSPESTSIRSRARPSWRPSVSRRESRSPLPSFPRFSRAVETRRSPWSSD